ncbi:nucleoside-diphosphate-sugar epimerase family protein [Trichoderma gamsii]|uniref:Nucleoside-diphosphate-sugar epimerase family protein n=1 Tax=Trichoderma gamsii TaxID=398673 RepID=A0A2P4ZQT5_9HYPO|nr:nucleoside-diphosphate-sugar epimerase family protein [Trichoderma gamsii]PON26646.1 nucleoside-diphosphate-sugar epimerase family protein [Trichoderma gamsii]
MSSSKAPILVTGAAGRVGGVGGRVVELLRKANLPVRALVRQEDERADRLRSLGAEVVVADLRKPEQVLPILQGCQKIFFCVSVSADYLEATMVMAAAARATSGIEIIVNLSQMTVAEMDLTHTTDSPQHKLQWLSEQALNWSGVPVTHLRPTAFQENALFLQMPAKGIKQSGTIRLPFGKGRVSPVATRDVAECAVQILLHAQDYVGKTVELTGPNSVDMFELAKEYASAIGIPVHYEPIPFKVWSEQVSQIGWPAHVENHISTMVKLVEAGRYDRYTDSVQTILGRQATPISSMIKQNLDIFKPQ